MGILDREALPANERLETAVERLLDHIKRHRLNHVQRRHAQNWAAEAAHAVFELHPDLREDGSLPRYFVAKQGRRNGLRGADLTEFVEREYSQGTWWKLVPVELLQDAHQPSQ